MKEKYIPRANRRNRDNFQREIIKRTGAVLLAGGLLFAGDMAHAHETANDEKPLDRKEAEDNLFEKGLNLEGVITGKIGIGGVESLSTNLPKTIEHHGEVISIQSIPTQETAEHGVEIVRREASFLYIPGGITFKGRMQSIDKIASSSSIDQLSVEIDWSKVDTHTAGAELENLPSITFDGIRIIKDQHGNDMIVGVPSASSPNKGLILLDLLSGAAEDGGIVTVGAESDNPVTINLKEAKEGFRQRVLPFIGDDDWKVSVEDIAVGIDRLTEVLQERGIHIAGIVDVDKGEVSSGSIKVPVVDRYMVIADADGRPSSQGYKL